MRKFTRIHIENVAETKPENPGFPASKNPGLKKAG
jgi:hypothetical protein